MNRLLSVSAICLSVGSLLGCRAITVPWAGSIPNQLLIESQVNGPATLELFSPDSSTLATMHIPGNGFFAAQFNGARGQESLPGLLPPSGGYSIILRDSVGRILGTIENMENLEEMSRYHREERAYRLILTEAGPFFDFADHEPAHVDPEFGRR